jgi:hypothetical protein
MHRRETQCYVPLLAVGTTGGLFLAIIQARGNFAIIASLAVTLPFLLAAMLGVAKTTTA